MWEEVVVSAELFCWRRSTSLLSIPAGIYICRLGIFLAYRPAIWLSRSHNPVTGMAVSLKDSACWW